MFLDLEEGEELEALKGPWYAFPPLRNPLLAGLLAGLTYGVQALWGLPDPLRIGLYLGALFLGGRLWAWEGLEGLRWGKVGLEVLMLAAALGLVLLGLWEEAVFLTVLYGVAEGLEELAYARTRKAIRGLLELAPKRVRVLKEGREEEIPAEEVRPGMVFLVRPGEAVATDGVVLEGRASLNEAALTGEAWPVEKGPGMRVFAGTLNLDGLLKVQATAALADNTLAKLVHLVEEAQERKGRTQRLIESFSRWYAPLVLLVALLMLGLPPLWGLPAGEWAQRAVVFLVAAAPCALVISAPIAVAAAIAQAGHRGVLIKGGGTLEALARIKVVALDKTGTLTRGKPEVTDVLLFGPRETFLRLVRGLGGPSEHPLAQAIARWAEEEGGEGVEVSGFAALPGRGVRALVQGRTLYMGSESLFSELASESPALARDLSALEGTMASWRAQGKTVVLVGGPEGLLGLLALRDQVRPGAREALAELRRLGVRLVLLTGDHEAAALALARELGLDEVRAGLTPEGKVAVVQALEEGMGPVAMVGDGVNDAPALARATVGIAMGAMGTDAAIEAADLALMGDDLTKVPWVLRLGRRVRRVSLQNLFLSLLVLAVLIPLALLGKLAAWLAVLVHEASELLAVANGLRLWGGRRGGLASDWV